MGEIYERVQPPCWNGGRGRRPFLRAGAFAAVLAAFVAIEAQSQAVRYRGLAAGAGIKNQYSVGDWADYSPANLGITAFAEYTLAEGCYYGMFYGCTSLTAAPSLLPATTLANFCYSYMFYDCTSLTAAPSLLPATTLAENCYSEMFEGCVSLTAAPDLPATTLAENCYGEMFYGCAKLSSVTCLATDISASNCTSGWLGGVAASGTFTKAAGMTGWPTGSASGIPNGWNVVEK